MESSEGKVHDNTFEQPSLYENFIRPESETYIKNKQLEIIEYNNKLRSFNERSIISANFDLKKLEKQREDIINDLSIRPGIVHDEKFDTYLIYVSLDIHKDLMLEKPEGGGTIIRFEPIKKD